MSNCYGRGTTIRTMSTMAIPQHDLIIPQTEIDIRKLCLLEQSNILKAQLQADLEVEMEKAMQSLPVSLQSLTLRQFLQLLALDDPKCVVTEPSAKRKKTIMGLSSEEVQRMTLDFASDPSRRLTRSMTAQLRKESLAGRESIGMFPPSTPRLFPGLPETPAAVRAQLRQQVHPQQKAQLVRIAGSTIRATNIMASQTPLAKPFSRNKPKSGQENKAPNPSVQNLIHMELSDGKMLDLDLTKSPGSIFMDVGAEKKGEVKEWLSQYASAFTNFIKRLGA